MFLLCVRFTESQRQLFHCGMLLAVCVFVCVCVYMCVYVCMCMHVCMHVCMYVCMYVCVHFVKAPLDLCL